MSLAMAFSVATLLQALMFALVFALPGFRERVSNIVLIAFMLAIACDKADQIYLMSALYTSHPQFAMIGNVFGAALAPLLYFHVRARADETFKPGWQEWYGALPVLILGIYVFGTYHLLPVEEKRALFASGDILTPMNAQVIPMTGDVVTLIFLAASVRVLHRHDQAILNWFSNTQDRLFGGIRTILFVMCGLVVLHFLWTLTGQTGFGLALGAGHFVLVNALGLSAFRQVDSPDITPQRDDAGGQKPSPDLGPVLEAVRLSLQEDALYLDPDLTVARLARHSRQRPRDVSEAINRLAGTNFYELVNVYRIRVAQERLGSDAGSSILDVAHACGFNSKSAFNTAFKRIAGMTPSAWRARRRSDLR